MKNSILLAVGVAASLGLVSCAAPHHGFVVTEKRHEPGYTVTTLPSGCRSEVIAGTRYYYCNGAYYNRRSNGYVVVEAPRRSRYHDEYTRYGNNAYHNYPDGNPPVDRKPPRGYTTFHY